MSTTEIFLIALVIIFSIPYLIWRIGRTDYYAPLVVVQTITGILLGPGVLGAVAPEYYSFVFTPAVVQALNGIAWWAVMVFVWGASVFMVAGWLPALSVAGKLAGIHLAGRILKWAPGEASLIGWLLQTKALIMIIFVNVLLDKNIITNAMFTALLLMAVGSTMLTIPVVSPKLARMRMTVSRIA